MPLGMEPKQLTEAELAQMERSYGNLKTYASLLAHIAWQEWEREKLHKAHLVPMSSELPTHAHEWGMSVFPVGPERPDMFVMEGGGWVAAANVRCRYCDVSAEEQEVIRGIDGLS